MGWLFTSIALTLLFCFLLGLLLGLLLWWLWRRGQAAEMERRRLESDAEIERLRLRVSSLKSAESRAEQLAGELESSNKEVARISGLESELTKFRTAAGLVPGLEKQVSALQVEADRTAVPEAPRQETGSGPSGPGFEFREGYRLGPLMEGNALRIPPRSLLEKLVNQELRGISVHTVWPFGRCRVRGEGSDAKRK